MTMCKNFPLLPQILIVTFSSSFRITDFTYRFKMSKILAPECEALIKAFSKDKLSYRAILQKLKLNGFKVSLSTVSRVIRNHGAKRNAASKGLKIRSTIYPRPKRTPEFLRKIDRMTKKKNPPSMRSMSKSLGVSVQTVFKAIHKDLKKNVRKKAKVHALKPRHVRNRRTTARKLYERHLAGQKSEFMVTLDEAWFYIDNCNGERRICYRKVDEKVPHDWVVEKPESFGAKIMVVGAISGKGVLPLHMVPPNVKINSKYYINKVLKPWLEKEVKKLYGKEACKVVIHHDQASSHTSKETAAYARDLKARSGITIMENADIPVKSPDLSPMDFFGFGYLKQRLFRRKATTKAGLWKVVQEEWRKVTPKMVSNVMNCWKRRCRLIRVTQGLHVEPISKIHRRSIPKLLSV